MDQVTIVDVTLRDGLQDQPQRVATDDKVQLARLLIQAGYQELELTSMVRPDWIPQTSDAEAVIRGVGAQSGLRRHVLVPNRRGLERALATDSEVITFVISASTQHNQRNLNCTTEESLARVTPLIKAAKEAGRFVRGTISTAFGCTLQGTVAPRAVLSVVDTYVNAGVNQICLADTVGMATTEIFDILLETVLSYVDSSRLAIHLHEGSGSPILRLVDHALVYGIRTFDAALGGLGGCPFAPGAEGNLKAEMLIPHVESHGYWTGIDSTQLPAIALTLGMALGKGSPIAAG